MGNVAYRIADDLAVRSVASVRDDEEAIAIIAELTHLTKRKIRRRLNQAHGRTRLRNLFNENWPDVASEEAEEHGEVDETALADQSASSVRNNNGAMEAIAALTNLSAIEVRNRLGEAHGRTLVRNLFLAEWPSEDEDASPDDQLEDDNQQEDTENDSAKQGVTESGDVVDDVEEVDEGEGMIHHPYDPTKTQIITKQQSIDSLISRIKHDEIDMAPDFQRLAGLWSPTKMSRLIESLLIRIPLPVFYFDGSDDSRWLVVDGLQRLTTFERFVVKKDLPLTGLEYLTLYDGYKFDNLPRDLQRRITETQVTLHIIQSGTPSEVKYNIFRRINTGGMILTPQEIRHALNQGRATIYLKKLASSKTFRRATANSISPKRMLDREMALRFLSFTIKSKSYKEVGNMDEYLNMHMRYLNKAGDKELNALEFRFEHAMSAAHAIFGDDAFRKRLNPDASRHPINKALFEAWSVMLGGRTSQEIAMLEARRKRVVDGFIELCNNSEFRNAVSQGTGDISKVQRRFSDIDDLITRILSE